tara:strand:+ start:86 stop:304 length:219 start_codon:yes stop_codon:yes gene_type:complete
MMSYGKPRKKFSLNTELLLPMQESEMSWKKADSIIDELISREAEELDKNVLNQRDVIKAKQLREAWKRLRQG